MERVSIVRRRLVLLAVAAGVFQPLGIVDAASPLLTYPIVDTGQSACYDDHGVPGCPAPGADFDGQDAQYTGNRPSYRDNGDGTVTDLVTGLMWQRDFRRVSFGRAEGDAKSSRVGGYDDWRVPTIKELYSLINFDGATGRANPSQNTPPTDARPYLDTRFFNFEYPSGNRARFIDAQYVTATTYLGLTMNGDKSFFGVNFADGRIKAYPQNGGPGRREWYGRWVRGNPDYGRNDFVDNRNGTVTDRATGLTWTKADSGNAAFRTLLGFARYPDGRLNWPEALRFCRTLHYAGAKDWRLPNAKELHSIVDYTRSPTATHSAALAAIFDSSVIQESDGSSNWPYIWTSTSHLDGRRPGDFAVYFAFGRALGQLGAAPGTAAGANVEEEMMGAMLGNGFGSLGGPQPGDPRPGGPGRPPPYGVGGNPGFAMPGGLPGSGGDEEDGTSRRRPGPPPPGPAPEAMGQILAERNRNASTSRVVLTDVHGAGAQRSSPKSGDEARLPRGAGPQGDVLRIYNMARCVRGGDASR